MKKVFYYEDELRDDFGTTVTSVKPIPKKYKYVSKNVLFKLFSFIVYRLIVRPLAFLYVKIKFFHKFVNKKAVRKVKGGFLLYGNHATIIGDAFIPNLLTYKRRNYIITGEQANSLTALLPLLNALGMVPLSEDKSQQVKLLRCIKQRIKEGHSVTVYPEAHVWPFYTSIRPYNEDSFGYAVITNAPVFCMTTCFKKKIIGKKPRAITYIDGPFYPNEELTKQERARQLRDRVYNTMLQRTREHSTYVYFEYKRKEKQNG